MNNGRTILQKVGTEGFRRKYPNFWIDFIQKMLDVFPNEWDYVIIPDCRFKNEIENWKNTKHNISTVRLERPDYISELTEEQQEHQSEIDLDNYNFDVKFYCSEGEDYIKISAKDFVEGVLGIE